MWGVIIFISQNVLIKWFQRSTPPPNRLLPIKKSVDDFVGELTAPVQEDRLAPRARPAGGVWGLGLTFGCSLFFYIFLSHSSLALSNTMSTSLKHKPSSCPSPPACPPRTNAVSQAITMSAEWVGHLVYRLKAHLRLRDGDSKLDIVAPLIAHSPPAGVPHS